MAINERDDPPGEADVLARAQVGDEEAFCILARANESKLFQQAVALCRNPSVAEDLTAETFIEAWKSIRRYNAACRFSTWLYAILLHRHGKWLRQARSRPWLRRWFGKPEEQDDLQVLEGLADAKPLPGEALASDEQHRALQEAIAGLPQKHRQVLLLRFYEGASLPEIAAALNISMGTVKSRLHHGLAKLRARKDLLNLFDHREDTEV